jgi:hypothetical protein
VLPVVAADSRFGYHIEPSRYLYDAECLRKKISQLEARIAQRLQMMREMPGMANGAGTEYYALPLSSAFPYFETSDSRCKKSSFYV